MTPVQHPLGVVWHPEWDAVRAHYDRLWAKAFYVASPDDVEMDDDHDDIPDEDFRPSVVMFVLGLALVVAAMVAQVLPAVAS